MRQGVVLVVVRRASASGRSQPGAVCFDVRGAEGLRSTLLLGKQSTYVVAQLVNRDSCGVTPILRGPTCVRGGKSPLWQSGCPLVLAFDGNVSVHALVVEIRCEDKSDTVLGAAKVEVASLLAAARTSPTGCGDSLRRDVKLLSTTFGKCAPAGTIRAFITCYSGEIALGSVGPNAAVPFPRALDIMSASLPAVDITHVATEPKALEDWQPGRHGERKGRRSFASLLSPVKSDLSEAANRPRRATVTDFSVKLDVVPPPPPPRRMDLPVSPPGPPPSHHDNVIVPPLVKKPSSKHTLFEVKRDIAADKRVAKRKSLPPSTPPPLYDFVTTFPPPPALPEPPDEAVWDEALTVPSVDIQRFVCEHARMGVGALLRNWRKREHVFVLELCQLRWNQRVGVESGTVFVGIIVNDCDRVTSQFRTQPVEVGTSFWPDIVCVGVKFAESFPLSVRLEIWHDEGNNSHKRVGVGSVDITRASLSEGELSVVLSDSTGKKPCGILVLQAGRSVKYLEALLAEAVKGVWLGHRARQRVKRVPLCMAKLQSYWRMRQQRDTYVQLRRACFIVQRVLKGHCQRRLWAAMKAIARFCQSMWRRGVHRKLYLHMRRASFTVQRWWRCVMCIRNYVHAHASVIRLQSWYRCRKCRRSYCVLLRFIRLTQRVWKKRFLLMSSCVSALRSIARRFLAKIRSTRRVRAAVQVQASWRCHRAKLAYSKHRTSIVRLQSWWRCWYQRQVYFLALRLVLIAQALVRRHVWRKRYLLQRSSVVLLQARMRGLRTRTEFAKKRLAARLFQAAFRRHKAMRRYDDARRSAAVKLQCLIRQRFARMELGRRRLEKHQRMRLATQLRVLWLRHKRKVAVKRQLAACVQLQTLARTVAARRRYCALRFGAIQLQYRWRRWTHRSARATMSLAATFIQAWWRRHVMRSYFLIVRCAAKKIARFRRWILLCRPLWRGRASVISLQSLYRQRTQRRVYRRVLAVIVAVQSRWRMIACRHRVAQLPKLVSKLQARWKRHLLFTKAVFVSIAVRKIQGCVRGWLVRRCVLPAVTVSIREYNDMPQPERRSHKPSPYVVLELEDGEGLTLCEGTSGTVVKCPGKTAVWTEHVLHHRDIKLSYRVKSSVALTLVVTVWDKDVSGSRADMMMGVGRLPIPSVKRLVEGRIVPVQLSDPSFTFPCGMLTIAASWKRRAFVDTTLLSRTVKRCRREDHQKSMLHAIHSLQYCKLPRLCCVSHLIRQDKPLFSLVPMIHESRHLRLVQARPRQRLPPHSYPITRNRILTLARRPSQRQHPSPCQPLQRGPALDITTEHVDIPPDFPIVQVTSYPNTDSPNTTDNSPLPLEIATSEQDASVVSQTATSPYDPSSGLALIESPPAATALPEPVPVLQCPPSPEQIANRQYMLRTLMSKGASLVPRAAEKLPKQRSLFRTQSTVSWNAKVDAQLSRRQGIHKNERLVASQRPTVQTKIISPKSVQSARTSHRDSPLHAPKVAPTPEPVRVDPFKARPCIVILRDKPSQLSIARFFGVGSS